MADLDPISPTAPLRPVRERRKHGSGDGRKRERDDRRGDLTDDAGKRRDDGPAVDDYA